MGCCGCSLRATAIFAAIFSLLQGSAWIGLAIWGLMTYGCQGEPTLPDSIINIAGGNIVNDLTNAISSITYMMYFYNVDCQNMTRPTIEVTHPEDSTGQTKFSVKWLESNTAVVERTNAWMLAYAILSGIWILASIVLLIVAVGNKKGKGAAALYYPWIIVMLAIVIADVTATIIFLLDMNATWGVKPFLIFLGVDIENPEMQQQWNDWNPGSNTEEVLFTIPSIIMGVLFSRFFVFWLTNLILLIYVLQAAIQVGKTQGNTKGRYQDPQANRNLNQSPAPNNDQWLYNTPAAQEAQARPISPSPRDEQQLQPRFQPQVAVAYPQQQLPQAQQTRASQQHQQHFAPQRSSHAYDPRGDYQNDGFVSDEPVRQRFVPPSNQEARHSYQNRAEPNVRTSPTAPVARNESLESRKSNSAGPTELRSQLPWSYTQFRDEPAVLHVNKQGVIREEDEYLPPIPVPDYTLHFPRRPRGDPPPPNPKPQKSALKGRNDMRY